MFKHGYLYMAFQKNGKSQSLGLVKSGAIEPKPEQTVNAEADKKSEVKTDKEN